MSTKAKRQANTEERGLLSEDLHPKVTKETEAVKASLDWAELVANAGGASPFRGRQFLGLVASGRAGYPALGGGWPANGEAREWREATGLTALEVAHAMAVNTELVDAWEAGQEPNADNWRGADERDDLSARRLYGAFKSYRQNGPYAPAPEPEPVPERPPVQVLMAEGFPRKELLDAAALGYQVEPWQLAGERNFLKVVVRGEVPFIPQLKAIPSGAELARVRKATNYSTERLGALLGAAASRVETWEAEIALPGADCTGGLAAALRLYGVLFLVDKLRNAA